MTEEDQEEEEEEGNNDDVKGARGRSHKPRGKKKEQHGRTEA